MPENTNTWQQIGLDAAHTQTENFGYGTIVAVIDTGIDYTHPALSDGVMQGWDFYSDDNDPIAPGTTILPIRILGPDGTGTVADLANAILWAEEQGADVINLSLGSTSYSSAVNAALNSVVDKGVMVVASGGNSGNQNVTYPASSMDDRNGQISVTSVDSNDIKSVFANYSYDIEMSAPGEQVFGPAPGGLKVAWSGTSMAAPMVAAALALGKGDNPVIEQSLTSALYHSTFNNRNLSGNSAYKSWFGFSKIGKGRLDVNNFYQNLNLNGTSDSSDSSDDEIDD